MMIQSRFSIRRQEGSEQTGERDGENGAATVGSHSSHQRRFQEEPEESGSLGDPSFDYNA